MPIHRRVCQALIVFLSSYTAQAQISQSKPIPKIVKVQVDPAGNLGTVPPRIFGSFLEPIDYSINNGVIAEILVNGSLESGLWNHAMLEQMFRDQPDLIESSNQTGIPLPWQPLNRGAGNRYELHAGDAANSWQSLEIMGTPDDLTGIKQRVYLPVPRTYGYNVSLYAKHVSGPSRLNISLRPHDSDRVLATSAVDVPAGEWTKYNVKLQLQPGDLRRLEPVDFAVSVEGDERVDVDQMSLMPDDAIGTFDPDVVRMSKEMNMTELRLGGNFSSYYHWKDGIGPEDVLSGTGDAEPQHRPGRTAEADPAADDGRSQPVAARPCHDHDAGESSGASGKPAAASEDAAGRRPRVALGSG